jgi:hypothetical protein
MLPLGVILKAPHQRDADHMPDAPKWDGKIHRPAKAGEGFRWDTADGAQRRAQIKRRRRRYAEARREAELERAEWELSPWRVKLTVTVVESLLWSFKKLGLYSD